MAKKESRSTSVVDILMLNSPILEENADETIVASQTSVEKKREQFAANRFCPDKGRRKSSANSSEYSKIVRCRRMSFFLVPRRSSIDQSPVKTNKRIPLRGTSLKNETIARVGSKTSRSSVQINRNEFPIGLRNSRRFSMIRRKSSQMSSSSYRMSSEDVSQFTGSEGSIFPLSNERLSVGFNTSVDIPNNDLPDEDAFPKAHETIEEEREDTDLLIANEESNPKPAVVRTFKPPEPGQIWGNFQFLTVDSRHILSKERCPISPNICSTFSESSHILEISSSDSKMEESSTQDTCFSIILCSGASIIFVSVCLSFALFIMKFIGFFDLKPESLIESNHTDGLER